MSLYDDIVVALHATDAPPCDVECFADHVDVITPERPTYRERAEQTRLLAERLTARGWHCTRSMTRVHVYRERPPESPASIVCRRPR